MALDLEQRARNAVTGIEFFVSRSWTPMQAAAIVGNLVAESNIDPDTGAGDEGSAIGIAQWRGDRQAKFEEIIGKHVDDASLLEQLEFVNWELLNTHRKAATLCREATTIEAATKAIDDYYERSAGLHLERRIKFAKQFLEQYELNVRLEEEVESSMDASDPPAQTQPGNENEPVPSSGFPATSELRKESFWVRLLELIRKIFTKEN